MRFAQVNLTFRFEAAHHLPCHQGKCVRMHGHNYRLDILLQGRIREEKGHPQDGMVIEFDDAKAIVNSLIIDQLDHHPLNELIPEEFSPPTTENVAYWIFSLLYQKLPHLQEVRVWETERSNATVTIVDFKEYLRSIGVKDGLLTAQLPRDLANFPYALKEAYSRIPEGSKVL